MMLCVASVSEIKRENYWSPVLGEPRRTISMHRGLFSGNNNNGGVHLHFSFIFVQISIFGSKQKCNSDIKSVPHRTETSRWKFPQWVLTLWPMIEQVLDLSQQETLTKKNPPSKNSSKRPGNARWNSLLVNYLDFIFWRSFFLHAAKYRRRA